MFMNLKEEIFGVRCELCRREFEICHDEVIVSINNKKVAVRKKDIGLLEPAEKFAVLGESACYLKNSGIFDLIGPARNRDFLLKINSRGYLHEFLVPEREVLFLK